MTTERLSGEVAVVTGAGRNIGRAIAELFAAEGASVVVADLHRGRAEEAVAAIEAAGNEATAVAADVADEAAVAELVETAVATYGGLDVLVNNAGTMDRADLLELPVDEFDRVLDVVLRGAFLCTREAARVMGETGGGRIVNLGSTSAHTGRPRAVAYATAKAGILNFTRAAARALAPHGVRVNAVSPTRTGSRTLHVSAAGEDAASGITDADRVEAIEEDIPLDRIGAPADPARAALFLVSPAASFVTGTELVVDGGRTA